MKQSFFIVLSIALCTGTLPFENISICPEHDFGPANGKKAKYYKDKPRSTSKSILYQINHLNTECDSLSIKGLDSLKTIKSEKELSLTLEALNLIPETFTKLTNLYLSSEDLNSLSLELAARIFSNLLVSKNCPIKYLHVQQIKMDCYGKVDHIILLNDNNSSILEQKTKFRISSKEGGVFERSIK
jgi:hypothetical protein